MLGTGSYPRAVGQLLLGSVRLPAPGLAGRRLQRARREFSAVHLAGNAAFA
jgi:hypothetical protein